MEITNKQLAIGGGIVILLLLFLKKRRSEVTVTAQPMGEVVREEIDGFGSGGGGVIPTTLTRESIITPVAVSAAPTLIPVTMPTPAPVMNLSSPSAPYAINSSSPSAPATSTVTPERATPAPAPAPSTPAITPPSKPVPLINANARFDGLDDYSFDGAIGF